MYLSDILKGSSKGWNLSDSSKHDATCLLSPSYFLSILSFAPWCAVAECPRLLATLINCPLRYWKRWSSMYLVDVGVLSTQAMNAAFQAS